MHGEFVDLEQVASAIETSPLFSCVFVHAEADKSAPVLVASLDLTAMCSRLDNKHLE